MLTGYGSATWAKWTFAGMGSLLCRPSSLQLQAQTRSSELSNLFLIGASHSFGQNDHRAAGEPIFAAGVRLGSAPSGCSGPGVDLPV
jgi:hypothetical protein